MTSNKFNLKDAYKGIEPDPAALQRLRKRLSAEAARGTESPDAAVMGSSLTRQIGDIEDLIASVFRRYVLAFSLSVVLIGFLLNLYAGNIGTSQVPSLGSNLYDDVSAWFFGETSDNDFERIELRYNPYLLMAEAETDLRRTLTTDEPK